MRIGILPNSLAEAGFYLVPKTFAELPGASITEQVRVGRSWFDDEMLRSTELIGWPGEWPTFS